MRLSKIGFFTLIIHREIPLSYVCQVCVKLYSPSQIYVVLLMDEAKARKKQLLVQPGKAVGVDLGITRLVTLSLGRALPRESETA